MEDVKTYDAPGRPNLFLNGIVGGIIAGIVFVMAEMLMNVLILGKPFLGPLRLISSILLGTQAIQLSYPLATSLIVGVIVHLVLSSIFGVVFVYLLSWLKQLNVSAILQLVYGAIYGLVLWVLDFLILAPVFFPQFTRVNQFWNGFVAHTFFFGLVLGIYVAIVYSQREVAG